MFPSTLLVVVLVLAAAIAIPVDNKADLILSAMEANANKTDNQIYGFQMYSHPPLFAKAQVVQGKFTSVAQVARTGDASISLATGKLILTTPFRLDTVTASFDLSVYDSTLTKTFEYSQTLTANHIGSGTLQIQLLDQCQGDFYGVDFKFDDQMMTVAGIPVPPDVTSYPQINDFVNVELRKKFFGNIIEWAKPYVEAVTREALVGLNFC